MVMGINTKAPSGEFGFNEKFPADLHFPCVGTIVHSCGGYTISRKTPFPELLVPRRSQALSGLGDLKGGYPDRW